MQTQMCQVATAVEPEFDMVTQSQSVSSAGAETQQSCRG